jgi:hypothetical protein
MAALSIARTLKGCTLGLALLAASDAADERQPLDGGYPIERDVHFFE